jgi:cobalt-zinc-cadmium efflux system protein
MTDQHGHNHSHGTDAHSHSHTPSGPGAERRIVWAMLLTGGFMVAEVVGGLISGSLALLADAGHMLTDVGALILAYAGIRFGRRPGDPRRTYGYQRLEVLAAFVNGITLLVLSAWILVEAARRLFEPVEVLSGTMLTVALVGLAVNVASFFILRSGSEQNVNIQGALIHVLGDLLGSVAAIAAALVIAFTGWMPIDPMLSAFVALLIIRSGWDITRRSGHILLEGTPEGLDRDEIARVLKTSPGVADVHHIHVWSLTSGRLLATLHLRPTPEADLGSVLATAKARLHESFGIDHSTIEIDFGAPSAPPGDGTELHAHP